MSRSITPAPSGSFAPDFITVPSSTGFSAGDYVYQKNGDFGLPPNVTSANFSVSPASPILAAGTGGTATLVNWRGYASPAQGSSTGQCAAKLTNGNIVIGYYNDSATRAYFRIVDTNNTTVVAETLISASVVPNTAIGAVGVIALTGGGFVVHYASNSGSKPAYGVYTNAGAVTTAFAADATYPTTILATRSITGCALPNGGFALASVGNAAVNAYFRSFGSTGVGIYAWTSGGAAVGAGAYMGIAARSDNSICIAWISTSILALYGIYNAAGGTITTGSFAVQNTVYNMDVACLSDDTFVLGYMFDGSAYSPRFRFLPTGNVLGSETTPPTTNISTTGYGGSSGFVRIFPLSSGGFVYFMGDGFGVMYYLFYSAAGVLAYSAPRVCSVISIQGTGSGTGASYNGITEITGYLSIYHAGNSVTSSNAIYELYNTKISLTDYNLLGAVTTTASVGTVSASAGAYARSTSLPTKASYVAANTEVLNLNQVMSTANLYTVTPNAVYSGAIDSVHNTTLPDGRFAIVYKDASSASVYFNVYSVAGVLQTTVFVGTSLTGAATRVRITALSSGKIAVAFLTTSTVLTLYVYSSSFAFIGSISITVSTNTYYDITGVLNDRIAAVYGAVTTNNVSFQMFSSAPASIQAEQTLAAHASPLLMTAKPTTTGGFWAQWVTSGSGPNIMLIYPNTAGTTYTKGALIGYGSSTANTGSVSPIGVNAVNTAIALSASSGTQLANAQISPNATGVLTTTSSPATFTTSNFGGNVSNCAFGVTGAGTFVYLGSGNASGNLYGFVSVNSLATAASTPLGNLSGITISSANGMQACITSSYGYNAVITWINSGNIGTFAIVNAYPFNATQSITAGVTGSAPTTPLNISSSSGYYLAGVAVTDCPAGGTGQIQTNGVANLNSQYSTTTAFQGFDFQNPVTVGVKGTAAGRTVTMVKGT